MVFGGAGSCGCDRCGGGWHWTEGLDAAALTNGFGLCIRLLDDDGEGLDGWLRLKRGVPPLFIRIRFK